VPVTLNARNHTLVTYFLSPSSHVATWRVKFESPLHKRTAEFLHVFLLSSHGLRGHHCVFHLGADITVVQPGRSELGRVHAIESSVLWMGKLTL
jgi:hypothetical protein